MKLKPRASTPENSEPTERSPQSGRGEMANALGLGPGGVPVIRRTPLASSTLVVRTT
jgi:hypothetical protein